MEVSLQNISRPQAIPAVAPLQFLTPQQIGAPTNGLASSEAGFRMGNEVAGPLAQAGEYVGEYYRPQAVAQREANIAKAHLATTGATQENQAELATPNLPLAKRTYEQNQVGAQNELVQPQKNLTLANIGSEMEVLPSSTQAKIAGQTEAAQAAANKVNATPNIHAPGEVVTSDQLTQDDAAQQNAIQQAQRNLEIIRVGNPLLKMIQDSISKGGYTPYHPSPDGKGFEPDAIEQEQVDVGGTPVFQSHNKTKNIWLDENNQPDPDQSPRTAARQTILDRGAAMVGQYTGENEALRGISKANQLDDPNLSKGQQMQASKIGANFNSLYSKNYEPKLQLFASFDSVAQKAVDPKTASGVPDVDLIDTAGRLYKGGAMTEVQYDAIKRASGLPDTIWNLPQSIGKGKVLTPQQRQDLIGSVENYKKDLQAAFQQDYATYAGKIQQINPKANVNLWLGTPNAMALPGKQKGAEGTSSIPSTNAAVKVMSREEYDKLPAGTAYIDPNGLQGVKP